MSSPVFAVALFLCVAAATWESSWSYPSNSAVNLRSKRSVDYETQEEVMKILVRLAQELYDSESTSRNEKRGIDLGLSRGFSGSQAAKHLMGLAAANLANGPGRKRRDLDLQ